MPYSVGLSQMSKKLDLIGKSESITKSFGTHRRLMLDDIAVPDIFYATADATLRYVETALANAEVLNMLLDDIGDSSNNVEARAMRTLRWQSLVEVKFWWDRDLGAAPYKLVYARRAQRIRNFGGTFANFPDYPFKDDEHYALLSYVHDTPQASQYVKAGYRTLAEIKACVDNDLDMELVRALV